MQREEKIKHVLKNINRLDTNFCESSLNMLLEVYNLGLYEGARMIDEQITKPKKVKKVKPEVEKEDFDFLD